MSILLLIKDQAPKTMTEPAQLRSVNSSGPKIRPLKKLIPIKSLKFKVGLN